MNKSSLSFKINLAIILACFTTIADAQNGYLISGKVKEANTLLWVFLSGAVFWILILRQIIQVFSTSFGI